MALLTKTGYNNILKRMYEGTGMSPDLEADFDRLRTDYDEREGYLREGGEVYDGDDKEEYEYVKIAVEAPAITEANVTDTAEHWRSEYNALKERYINRFFGGDSIAEDTTILGEDETETENSEEKTTYEDLFE